MMQNLKIDPEFQSKIPPLTAEERSQLEANILEEGRLLNPLIVWNSFIVDGHNRFEILKEHPEIEYTVLEKEFASREEAIVWICKNQLGRRNLTPEQRRYLVGKQYEAEKLAHGGSRKMEGEQPSCHGDNLIAQPKTCERIAQENGVAVGDPFGKVCTECGCRRGCRSRHPGENPLGKDQTYRS